MTDNTKTTKTILGPDCKIKGQIALDHDAVIMGQISGQVQVGGMLEVTETARIEGTLVAGGLRLGGKAQADVVAEHGMELLASAQLTGHLYTTRLSVVDGATFEGHVVVGPNAMQAASETMKNMQMDLPENETASQSMEMTPDVNTIPKSLDEILLRRRHKTNGQATPVAVGATD